MLSLPYIVYNLRIFSLILTFTFLNIIIIVFYFNLIFGYTCNFILFFLYAWRNRTYLLKQSILKTSINIYKLCFDNSNLNRAKPLLLLLLSSQIFNILKGTIIITTSVNFLVLASIQFDFNFYCYSLKYIKMYLKTLQMSSSLSRNLLCVLPFW